MLYIVLSITIVSIWNIISVKWFWRLICVSILSLIVSCNKIYDVYLTDIVSHIRLPLKSHFICVIPQFTRILYTRNFSNLRSFINRSFYAIKKYIFLWSLMIKNFEIFQSMKITSDFVLIKMKTLIVLNNSTDSNNE